tara:strand:+ start:2396 stop:9823 length:7428 start_codon:yes stop_codon:yes gene_type:complete
MANATKEQINQLWKRLLTAHKEPDPFKKLDILSASPAVKSFDAGCVDGSDMSICPDNNIFFKNIIMEDASLEYPSKIEGENPTDLNTNEQSKNDNLSAAQNLINVPDIPEPEDGTNIGATHYVFIPSTFYGEENFAEAVVRAGFISSKENPEKITELDIVVNGKYNMSKNLFKSAVYGSGPPEKRINWGPSAVIETLPHFTPVRVIREGFGIFGYFSQIAWYDTDEISGTEEWKNLARPVGYKSRTNDKSDQNYAFIDSRLLKRYRSYYDSLQALDSVLEQEISKIKLHPSNPATFIFDYLKRADLPLIQTNDPTKSPSYDNIADRSLFFSPISDTYQAFFNQETLEYVAVLNLPTNTTIETAKKEGIKFLLEFYGKRFDDFLIDRLMYLGGDNYNIGTRPQINNASFIQNKTQGLFAKVKRVSSSERPDGLKTFTVAIPATYMDHPSLEPDLSNLLTRKQYIDSDIVSYLYWHNLAGEFFLRNLRLQDDLQIFKKRIEAHEGSLTITSADIDDKIKRITSFRDQMFGFLTINDIDMTRSPNALGKEEIEFGLDDNFKVVFVTYTDETGKARFLRKGMNVLNEAIQAFADPTTSAYLFYADQIREAIKEDTYHGIDLVQKFTFPIPVARPSDKSQESDSNSSPAPKKEDEQEIESLQKKDSKTAEDVKKENSLLGSPERKRFKAEIVNKETFDSGDEVYQSFDRIINSSNSVEGVFNNVLDKAPVYNLMAKSALCLANRSDALSGTTLIEGLELTLDALQDFTKIKNQVEILSKNLDQIGFEFPKLSYSDDPLAEMSDNIRIEILNTLNTELLPVVQTVLQDLSNFCQGLNLNLPLESPPDSDPNFDQLSPDELENLNNLFNASAKTNFPGDQNIFDSLNPGALQNIRSSLYEIVEQMSGMPLSPQVVSDLQNLLQVLSSILRPTEICSLLAGEATQLVLSICLTIIRQREEFLLLSEYLNTTDAVKKFFIGLGKYANKSICSTAVSDLSLISLLCENELNQRAYCEVLQKKGFTPEECQEIIEENNNDDQQKLKTLTEILSAENISDYFQERLPEVFCNADEPGLAPVNDDFMTEIIESSISSTLQLLETTLNAELKGVTTMLIHERTEAYGGETPRPPEIGRDYTNQDFPLGSSGTPMSGKLFYKTAYLDTDVAPEVTLDMLPPGMSMDDYEDLEVGSPLTDNWPKTDKTVREVSPKFVENANATRDIGSIKIETKNTSEFTKRFSVSIDQLEQSLLNSAQDEFLRLVNTSGEESLDQLSPSQKAEVEQTYNNIMNSLADRVEQKNLVSYKLPSYQYLSSTEAEERNLPISYSQFAVTKIPAVKDGNNYKTVLLNGFEEVSDKETINRIEFLKDYPQAAGQGTIELTDTSKITLQEYTFAKILSISLAELNSSESGNADVKVELENEFVNLFSFALASKQNEIIEECLKSRFFTATNLDKILLEPVTGDAYDALACSDHPNIDLENLRKGLLDFGDTIKEVTDFYNDMACETHERSDDEADPLSDAIRYGTMLIFVKLIVAEAVINSLFFFSRFDALETMSNSNMFLSMIMSKFKNQAEDSKVNPLFFEEVEEVAYKKMFTNASGFSKINFLSKEIIFDDNENVDDRQYTNFRENIFNVHDVKVLKEWQETQEYTPVVKKILEINPLEEIIPDPDDDQMAAVLLLAAGQDDGLQVLIDPVLAFYETRFKDLAVKLMINDAITKMAPRVNSIFLDIDRARIDTKKTLLSSNILFDLQNDLVDIEGGIERQGFESTTQLFQNVEEEILTSETAIFKYIKSSDSPGQGQVRFNFSEFIPPEITYGPESPRQNIIEGIDYKSEKTKASLAQTTAVKNICLDAYDNSKYYYAAATKSTFYDSSGNLTKLGESTKNGGFILQKYISIKFNNKDAINFNSEASPYFGPNEYDKFVKDFRKVINTGVFAIDTVTEEIYDVNPENYDEGLVPWGEDPIEVTTTTTTGLYGKSNELLLSHKQFDFALRAACTSISGIDVKLNKIFKYIRHGVRLVYVMPHNMQKLSLKSQQDFAVKLSSPERFVAKGSAPAEKIFLGEATQGQIENLLLTRGFPNEADDLKVEIFSKKVYQIKEPAPSNVVITENLPGVDKFYNFYLSNIADNIGLNEELNFDIFNPYTFSSKKIQSFYLIPIFDANEEEDLNSLENLNISDVLFILKDDPGQPLQAWNEDVENQKLAFRPSIAVRMGAKPRSLVDSIFEKPNVKVLNDYTLSSKNLLNFAVLQQTYFPHNESFDIDKLFQGTKNMLDSLFEDSQEGRDDWSPMVTKDVLAGWGEEMNRAMSAILPQGSFYQWLSQVIPKWALRHLLKATDPCMKVAFNQQEAYGWDDSKLPEIIFGSLLVNPTNCVPTDFDPFGLNIVNNIPKDPSDPAKVCAPGIRPVPIFPPIFPFFGNPFLPITPPGLTYVGMQFLTGFTDKYTPQQDTSTEDAQLVDLEQTGVSSNDSSLCGPDSNLNQDPYLITQED